MATTVTSDGRRALTSFDALAVEDARGAGLARIGRRAVTA
jgi:hypothetical protein